MRSAYTRPEFRPAPTPSAESQAFWTGGRAGQLLITRCRSCGHFFHPPSVACFRCRSTDVGPEPVSGRGRIAAFTINRQQWLPSMPPPYVVALVELAEEPDVRIFSNVVDVDPEAVALGDEVEVFFEEWGADDDQVWVPLFRPVGGAR